MQSDEASPTLNWKAFCVYRAKRRQHDGGTPWIAVLAGEVVGQFLSKDAAEDALFDLRPNLRDCAVYHWSEEPAEVVLCYTTVG
ncbi:MAG: hypothetical protein ACKVS8_02625 [Phycisphaerales bacterium]